MDRRRLIALVLVTVVAGAAVAAWAAWTLVTTRTVSVTELRAGRDFTLSGVGFHQTGFSDGYTSDPPVADAPVTVSFNITFPDGTSEAITFSFDGYCAGGTVSEKWTVHRGPGALFRNVCGQDFITVRVS